MSMKTPAVAALALAIALQGAPAQAAASPKLKAEAVANVEAQRKNIQVMVDTIFSYAEPGFQEVRTSAYLEDILEKNGFKVTRGVAGIPTAFTATWGEGGPVVALGSDIDNLLGTSQTPGLPYLKPLTEGAPGHGEGHNTGMPLVVAAAIAAKEVMEKNHIPGRLMIWPGVAEELLATKAYYVRDGLFKDVDLCIFNHVSSDFTTAYGELGSNGMVSVEYTFKGRTAMPSDPWDGLSALDAVEIMDTAWNFRREHLPVTQRSHYVITNGGGQPNVVPDKASVWYYFRDQKFASVKHLYDIGTEISQAAAKATGTTVTQQTLGYAAPNLATSRWPRPPMPTSRRSACPNGAPTTRPSPRRCRPSTTAWSNPCPIRSPTCPRRKTARVRSAAGRMTLATSCGRCPPSPSAIPPTSPI
jgi:aminobenzoyl-glutamate utilization protein B